MLEIDLSLDESSDEPRVYALELLSAKLKRQIRSKKHLCFLLRVTARIFPLIKAQESPPLDLHHAVERGKHRAARTSPSKVSRDVSRADEKSRELISDKD